MSGPMAAGYGIETAVLVSAQSIVEGIAEITADMAEADKQAAATREQRLKERQRMREARQAGLDKQRREAEARAARIEAMLRQQSSPATSGATQVDLEALIAAGALAQEQLAAYLRQVGGAGATADAAIRQALVVRILARLQLDDGEPVPSTLDALATAIMQAPSPDRAETLATELRLQVQQHNDSRVAAAEEKELQEAAAIVLEASLKDLGYAVEDIAETLFVEGGIAHFQRADWGDYYIRLRIDPKRQAMNFNVVRAGTTGEDRKREDMLAEERWCSEFPKLFDTLKARGIPINVTRLLQAGEAPVQVVDAATLPARAVEERRHQPLKARSIE